MRVQGRVIPEFHEVQDFQGAFECWSRLMHELGTTAHTRTADPLGELARHRVRALNSLYFSLLAELKPHALLEIGAHNAETSRRFVTMSDGIAHAYEAGEDVYNRVTAAGLPDRVEMFRCAIGPSDGEVSFFVPIEERLKVWGSTKRRAGNVATVEIKVPMCTLDSAASKIERIGRGKDIALWIDVEGAGLEVLRSGLKTLKDRVALVFIEVNDLETYAGASTALNIIDILRVNGFVVLARDNQYPDAWNLLAAHETSVFSARQLVAKWMYKHAGFNHVATLFAKAPEPGNQSA